MYTSDVYTGTYKFLLYIEVTYRFIIHLVSTTLTMTGRRPVVVVTQVQVLRSSSNPRMGWVRWGGPGLGPWHHRPISGNNSPLVHSEGMGGEAIGTHYVKMKKKQPPPTQVWPSLTPSVEFLAQSSDYRFWTVRVVDPVANRLVSHPLQLGALHIVIQFPRKFCDCWIPLNSNYSLVRPFFNEKKGKAVNLES